MLSEYKINYHSHVILIYDNPNIILTVKYLNISSEITVDYNLPVETLLSSFIEVGHIQISLEIGQSVFGSSPGKGSG